MIALEKTKSMPIHHPFIHLVLWKASQTVLSNPVGCGRVGSKTDVMGHDELLFMGSVPNEQFTILS